MRDLKDVPELKDVWSGASKVVRSAGINLGAKAIQEALNEIADKLPDYPECRVGDADGKFGPKTEAAVKAFQAVNQGLEVMGEVDVSTLKKIDEAFLRAQSIQVNDISHVTEDKHMRMIGYNDRFKKLCVLTFDDGPNAYTPRILDILKEKGIQGATFCVQGINVKAHPQILQRIVAEGHVLANHTYDHPDLRTLNAQEIEHQLQSCQDAVNKALGAEHSLQQMRPPYGAINDKVKEVLLPHAFDVLMWQVDSEDWRKQNQQNLENIVNNVFAGSAPATDGRGGLILFHDIHKTTGDILPKIIDRLATDGMKVTTAQKLLDQKYQA